jgi:hypothetical protein
MVARDEEYVFKIAGPLVISGKVVDKETGRPVPKFKAVPGLQWETRYAHFLRDGAVDGRDGRYRLAANSGYEALVVRIEATGYRPVQSRLINDDEGDVTVDFALERGQDVVARVLTSTGEPAVGAAAAITPPDRSVSIAGGSLSDNVYAVAREVADNAGRIQFVQQEGQFQLTVTHPSGFACVWSEDGTLPGEIKLAAWSRFEGTFRVGAKPAAGVTLDLGVTPEPFANAPNRTPQIYADYEATTDAEGRFAFDFVLPGRGRVGRRLIRTVDEGATEVTSSKREPVTIAPGAMLQVDLGGRGRPVVGKLVPPKGQEGQIVWSFASISLDAFTPMAPPADANDPASMQRRLAWQQNVEQVRDASPNFWASCDKTGAFRIDDVPPGDYVLRVDFDRQPGGRLVNYSVAVPTFEGEQSDESLDLGEVQLQP